MTEFYGRYLKVEEQRRMFQSWPLKLDMYFMKRKGKESKIICFYGIFEKVFEKLVDQKEIDASKNSSHGFSPYIYVERRLEKILNPVFEGSIKNEDIFCYKLCRETFQNLLRVDDFYSFYKTPDDKKMEMKLEPIVMAICESIREFESLQRKNENSMMDEIMFFYIIGKFAKWRTLE